MLLCLSVTSWLSVPCFVPCRDLWSDAKFGHVLLEGDPITQLQYYRFGNCHIVTMAERLRCLVPAPCRFVSRSLFFSRSSVVSSIVVLVQRAPFPLVLQETS